MTSTTSTASVTRGPDGRLTARWVLFRQGRPAVKDVGKQLMKSRCGPLITVACAGLSVYGRSFVRAEIATFVDNLLGIDVSEALSQAWSKHSALEVARQRTRADKRTELVELATHQVTSVHPGHIDVVVDGRPLLPVDAEVGLAATLRGVRARVAEGRVAALESGESEVTVSLSVMNEKVAERTFSMPTSTLLRLHFVEVADEPA